MSSFSPNRTSYSPTRTKRSESANSSRSEMSKTLSPFQARAKLQIPKSPTKSPKFDKFEASFSSSRSFNPATYESSSTNNDNQAEKILFSFDLLKTMTPKNCIRYLDANPLFLRTMVLEGKLDPEIVSSVAVSLTQNELQKFIQNMTNELNYYSSFYTCNSLQDCEEKIVNLIPMTKATIWVKASTGNFLQSYSLKQVLMTGKSICWKPFEDKQDLILGDPGNHPNFNIDFDLPLLNGTKSLMLLPILSVAGEVVAVIQLVGFKKVDGEQALEFPPYYQEVLKIVRDIITSKFFGEHDIGTLPSSISNVFNDIDKCSESSTAQQITRFLKDSFPCEGADIFKVDDDANVIVRLTDGKVFNSETGGISYEASKTNQIINLPHVVASQQCKTDIDTALSNRSILSRSVIQSRFHFVITLRAKPNAPSFNPKDSRMLVDISPVVCDAIKLAKWLEDQTNEMNTVKTEMKLMKVLNETMTKVANEGMDRWEAMKSASKEYFGCEKFFVSMFDGRYMKFLPSEVKYKFEECTAGSAYIYRDAFWGDPSNEKSKFNPQLYQDLGVECQKTFCFPYRSGGRVAGAIELIDPTEQSIPQEAQKLFGTLCACLLSGMATKQEPQK